MVIKIYSHWYTTIMRRNIMLFATKSIEEDFRLYAFSLAVSFCGTNSSIEFHNLPPVNWFQNAVMRTDIYTANICTRSTHDLIIRGSTNYKRNWKADRSIDRLKCRSRNNRKAEKRNSKLQLAVVFHKLLIKSAWHKNCIMRELEKSESWSQKLSSFLLYSF